MKSIEPQHLSDRIDDLEKRMNYLELKVNRPPPEDVQSWVSTFYNSLAEAAKASGVTVSYIHHCISGKRPASDKIINRMIHDGFYGVDAMKLEG